MAKKSKRKYNNVMTEYKKYSIQYNEQKKQGLIKRGMRKFGKRQFAEYVEDMKKYEHMSTAESRKDLLRGQNKLGALSKRDVDKIYNQYKKQGYVETEKWETTTSKRRDRTETKFRKKTSFLRNVQANQLIALAIDSGMTKQEAVEEYGYQRD